MPVNKPNYQIAVGRMVEESKSGRVGNVVKLEGTTAVVSFPDGYRRQHIRSLVVLPTQAEIREHMRRIRVENGHEAEEDA